MQAQIDPLVLVLDLEQLLLRSPEELLPLLENHILLIIMGQLRDIKERERLSRGLCREYNKLFEKNDILVFPRPLSTKQTDARLLAPRKLAHLVGAVASAMTPAQNPETSSAGASSEPAPAPTVWARFIRIVGFALLLLAALLPVLGVSLIRPQSHSKVALGARDIFEEPRSHREPRAPALDQASCPKASGSQPRSVLGSRPGKARPGKIKSTPVAASRSRARLAGVDQFDSVHFRRHREPSSLKELSPQSATRNAPLEVNADSVASGFGRPAGQRLRRTQADWNRNPEVYFFVGAPPPSPPG